MIRINKKGKKEIALINIFVSINGEGYNSGKITTFIRTFGCNLRCVWCDTKECWNEENMKKVYPERSGDLFYWMTAEEIFEKVEQIERGWVYKSICLTGGEPLMEDNRNFMVDELLPLFVNARYDVGIETNGAIDYTEYKAKFGNSKIINSYGDREGITIIADYKLHRSGMEKSMMRQNLFLYSPNDLIKMVISDDPLDWEELDWIVNESGTKASIYLSPCFDEVTMTKIPEYVISHPDKHIRAQIQIHKIFWNPKEKDV